MISETSAAGLRVLLVDDEPIVAMLAEDLLESIGCIVAGTAATVAEAQASVAALAFDVAMLDINLDGEDGLIVADMLKARGIPYVIATGYDARRAAPQHADAPMLAKPYAISELENALCRAVGRA